MEIKLRIDWSDMDMFGHVNNIAYFRYLQSARVNFWQYSGISGRIDGSGTGPILASCKCDFKKELNYPGNVRVKTTVKHIGNSSYILSHQLFNDQNAIVAEGEDIIVNYDFSSKRKSPIPEADRALLSSIS